MTEFKGLKALRENLERTLVSAREAGDAVTRLGKDEKGPRLPHSPNARGKKTDQKLVREGHSGRRGDILEDFHEKKGIYKDRSDDEKTPLILKVTIAGSACEVWKSHGKGGKKTDEELARIDIPNLDGMVTEWAPQAYKNEKGDATFAGPMALQGMLDEGKNSIGNLEKTVPIILLNSIPDEYKENNGKGVVLLIKAHSRGAVAASLIAEKLKAALSGARVELTQFDPVPGQFNYGKRSEIAVGDWTQPERPGRLYGKYPEEQKKASDSKSQVLDATTIVYAITSGYAMKAFEPQKVHGAQRIIVSRQSHGGGLIHGYEIDGEIFKGARLNSMPPGAYYEVEVKEVKAKAGTEQHHDDTIGVLKRMNKAEFNKMVDEVFDNRRAGEKHLDKAKANLAKAKKTGDAKQIALAEEAVKTVKSGTDGNRIAIIKGVLAEFFAKNG